MKTAIVRSPDHRATGHFAFVCFATRRQIMSKISKVVMAAAITIAGLASPALADNVVRHTGHASIAMQRDGLYAFAKVAGNPSDPALTGGGSSGYNANLRQN
jgi:hypothetical protein